MINESLVQVGGETGEPQRLNKRLIKDKLFLISVLMLNREESDWQSGNELVVSFSNVS